MMVSTRVSLVLCLLVWTTCASFDYRVGAGLYDITGPAAEVGMMGYAMFGQRTAGVHFRLHARAFVVGDNSARVVFVSTDSCMIYTGVKEKVVEELQGRYGDTYSRDNVMLSGIHTHSGPGGYSYYAIYDLTSLGFQKENFDTIVNGIVAAIQLAHSNFEASKPVSILTNSGELLDTNTNRSPSAYTANPQVERNKYTYNVDKEMVLLRFDDAAGKELGMVNWFPVHGTSMNNTNLLISGDNKGYASYLFEKTKNGNKALPGMGPFVAAFAQSNEGDVSPNTKGAFCENGVPCEVAHSTCDGSSEGCHGYGPGKDDFQSTEIIGANQFKRALELYQNASVSLSGPVRYLHTFVDFSNVTVDAKWTSTHQMGKTCPGALGDSFAGGTTDGPGDFDFRQGTNDSRSNEYWNFLAHFLSNPSDEQIQCQSPKPILFNTGGISFPSPWTPSILPLQVFQIGQLFIIGCPGEFTTMSGRRLRDTVRNTLEQYGVTNDSIVVIAGLSNAYSQYITTYEEYSFQRYEGASTLFGPHTLAAYQQEFSKLAAALAKGVPVPPGPTPPDLSGKTFNFQPGVILDTGSFGAIHTDANPSYHLGDLVEVVFYGADLRNDFLTQKTFLTVEREVSGQWVVEFTDDSWETKLFWKRHLVSESLVTITWSIPLDATPGTYRIQTFGKSRDLIGTLTPYSGTSSSFSVN